MSKYFKTALVLGLICAVSAISLSLLNKVTAPKIKEYEESISRKALEEVACGFQIGDKVVVSDNDFVKAYYKLTEGSALKGYILELSGSGYGGTLSLSAGFYVTGEIMQVKLVSDDETPGVGKKAENEGYMDKFIGTGSNVQVPTSKSMLSEADALAVSGASITFGGISKALSKGSEFVKSLGGAK